MAEVPSTCDSFAFEDAFKRKLHFFAQGEKYYRRILSPEFIAAGEPEVKEISKVVYALQWLEVCQRHGVEIVVDRDMCKCGRQMLVTRTCLACDRSE